MFLPRVKLGGTAKVHKLTNVSPDLGTQFLDFQLDVSEAIEMLARTGGYRPVETGETPGLQCSRQQADGGKLLELCLFAGKHELKVWHLARAWRIFEAPKGG